MRLVTHIILSLILKQSQEFEHNKLLGERKTEMYKQVLKKIDKLSPSPDKPKKLNGKRVHDKLYQEFKQWGQAKPPQAMNIHTDGVQRRSYKYI